MQRQMEKRATEAGEINKKERGTFIPQRKKRKGRERKTERFKFIRNSKRQKKERYTKRKETLKCEDRYRENIL